MKLFNFRDIRYAALAATLLFATVAFTTNT